MCLNVCVYSNYQLAYHLTLHGGEHARVAFHRSVGHRRNSGVGLASVNHCEPSFKELQSHMSSYDAASMGLVNHTPNVIGSAVETEGFKSNAIHRRGDCYLLGPVSRCTAEGPSK